jgi:hypothetical protein
MLLPMQCLVHVEDDIEFCQLVRGFWIDLKSGIAVLKKRKKVCMYKVRKEAEAFTVPTYLQKMLERQKGMYRIIRSALYHFLTGTPRLRCCRWLR